MAMQFGLVTDAGCSLTPEMCREMQIVRVPAGITADGKVYADDDGLNMDVLDAALSAAKTSSAAAPSPEDYISAFEKAEKDGAHGIAVLAMSSVFSSHLGKT